MQTLESLDIHDLNALEDWLERFELHAITNKAIKDENVTAFYLTYIGKEAYSLLKDLAFPKKLTDSNPKELHKLLIDHLKPQNFELTERAKFHSLIRDSSESYKDFLLRLQKQSSKCNFGNNLSTQLRDRLVAGINDQNMQQKLLQEQGLTFDNAKTILTNVTSIQEAVRDVSQTTICKTKLAPARFREKYPKQQLNSQQTSTNAKYNNSSKKSFHTNKLNCYSCGGEHLRQNCSFRNAKCFKCDRIGHIAKVCRKNSVKIIYPDSENDKDVDGQDVTVLHTELNTNHHVKQALFTNSGNKITFIVDTGSPVSIISKSILDYNYPDSTITTTHSKVSGITGHKLEILGKSNINIIHENNNYCLDFLVTKGGPCILGLDNLRILNLSISLFYSNSENSAVKIQKLTQQCSKNAGGMRIEPINIKCNSKPNFFRARPLPFGMRDAVKANLDYLEKDGIIKKVESSEWATPIVTVMKKNGQVRLCGDYRISVNPYLEQTAITTPEMEEIFSKLSDSKYFSRIDLQNAFLQVPLSDEAQKLTTINTPFGLYRYVCLPFGLSVSPGIFQQVVDSIIDNLQGVISYQDDLIVYGKSEEDHNAKLQTLLHRLIKYNVKVNSEKSLYCVNSLTYLGVKLSGMGITPDPKQVEALTNMPSPNDHKQLRSTLGLLQFYSKFIDKFSTIVEPLFALQNTEKFNWQTIHEESLRQIIKIITSLPVLAYFNPTKHSVLTTDASDTGLGACLEQDGKPVIFISRRLSASEQGYSTTQKEALCIYWAVKRLHKYLFGLNFTLCTDHEALKHIFDPKQSLSKSTSSMLLRWSIFLSGYQYSILYRPGKRIPHSDFLSRYSFQEKAPLNSPSFFLSTLPIDRNHLIDETRSYYGSVISALRNGWSLSAKKRFADLYQRREEMSLAPDNIIFIKDLMLIPPSCRKTVLEYLHQGHMGRDKMKSLARLSCWWSDINRNIEDYVRECTKCNVKPHNHSTTCNWPGCYKPLQRLHADFCGPFLGKYHALVIIDAYSKYPEVFLTEKSDTNFVIKVLRKYFSREGIAQTLVTDNGTPFSSQKLKEWTKLRGCAQIFSPPRHPQSNGLAENFIRSLKNSIRTVQPTTFEALDNCIDNYLFQYRNATHAATKKTPAFLFKGRNLRTALSLDTTEVSFSRGNENRVSQGVVVQSCGKRLVDIVDVMDGSVHRRHMDQIHISKFPDQIEQNKESANANVYSSTPMKNATKCFIPASPIGDDKTSSPTCDETLTEKTSRPVRNRRAPDYYRASNLKG